MVSLAAAHCPAQTWVSHTCPHTGSWVAALQGPGRPVWPMGVEGEYLLSGCSAWYKMDSPGKLYLGPVRASDGDNLMLLLQAVLRQRMGVPWSLLPGMS